MRQVQLQHFSLEKQHFYCASLLLHRSTDLGYADGLADNEELSEFLQLCTGQGLEFGGRLRHLTATRICYSPPI